MFLEKQHKLLPCRSADLREVDQQPEKADHPERLSITRPNNLEGLLTV